MVMFDVTCICMCIYVECEVGGRKRVIYSDDGHNLSKQTLEGLNVEYLKHCTCFADVMFCTQIDMMNL